MSLVKPESCHKPFSRIPITVAEILGNSRAWKVSSLFANSSSSVKISSYIFTLHSTVTVSIFAICTVFVGMKQYFGEPIECLNILLSANSISMQQMQQYCWMEGAFTVVNPSNPRNPLVGGPERAYPGVGPFKPLDGDSKMPHKYYQWVYYLLVIQMILFYLPKQMWKIREDNRLHSLVEKLKYNHIFTLNRREQYETVQDTFDIVMTSGNFFWGLVGCEVFCLVHLVLEIWFLDLFLGGRFLYLGFHWLFYTNLADDSSFDPLIQLFPRVVKCSFHKFGSSGSLETIDTMCFLSLNIVNEKVFAFLWFWFIILLLITIFHLTIYRSIIICVPYFRFMKLRSWAPMANKNFLKKLNSRVGNWFVLHVIASNIRQYYFKDLIDRMATEHWDEKTDKPMSKRSLKEFVDSETGLLPVDPDRPKPTYESSAKEGIKDEKYILESKKGSDDQGGDNPPDPGWLGPTWHIESNSANIESNSANNEFNCANNESNSANNESNSENNQFTWPV